MKGYKRIRVFPDRDLRATRLEMAVIDCRTFQRLRDVKQLGQSAVAFPTAEHSRFSHALGALYWVSKMLSYMKENTFAESNRRFLDQAEKVIAKTVLQGYPAADKFDLEVSWFEQLIRLAALLHDITHLPFGHTLEDQAGLLPRHDEDPDRIEFIFERLKAELVTSPHLADLENGEQVRKILYRLLEQCKSLYYVPFRIRKDKKLSDEEDKKWSNLKSGIEGNERFFPFLTFAYDIVNNTICADLIDYLQRDSLYCGMPWTLDKGLLSQIKVLEKNNLFRFGVAVSRNGKLRHDVVTAVLSLLRARYDITEKVYYHHTKCAADAMLEKAIRTSDLVLGWELILTDDLGDEALLRHIGNEFQAKENKASSLILDRLRSRRFHKPVYKLRKGSDWSNQTHKTVLECNTPAGRTQMELAIANRCNIPLGSVVVSCLPFHMQLKEAEALVEWIDGEVLPLSSLPKLKHYLPEVTNLTERYLELWSLSVYIDQDSFALAVESVCERLFSHSNDPLIAEYIRKRYPKAFEVKEQLSKIAEAAEIRTISQLNVAYGGGSPEKEIDIEEVVLDMLEEGVAERRGQAKMRRGAEREIKGETGANQTTTRKRKRNQAFEKESPEQPPLMNSEDPASAEGEE